MATRIGEYLLSRGDDIGDPNVLNKRLRDIDLRLSKQEDIQKDWTSALQQVQQTGIEKVNEVLFPAYQRIQELGQLGAMFTAHSATEIEISEGLKRLTIDEDERDAFAPAAFVAAFVEENLNLAILGQVQNYDRASGDLEIVVTRFAGTGTGANWVIHAASDTDNAEAAEEAKLYKEAAESARNAAQSASTTALEARGDVLDARDDVSLARDESVAARNTAVDAKDTVVANLASMDKYYLGRHATDPVTDNQGDELEEGTQYYNTTAKELRVYKGVETGWVAEYLPADVGGVVSVFGRTGAAIGAADGDYSASQIVFTPAGGLASTRVQAALAELGNGKAAKATTLAGYGITDAYTKSAVDTALGAKADAATTLAGYGITNAYTKSQTDSAITGNVVDNLTTNDGTKSLSAAQGKALKDLIDNLGDTTVVANLTAAATLTGLDKGDIIHVEDAGAGKWVRYQVTAAGDGTWTGCTKVVFWTQDQAPASHGHVIGDITGLQTALDAKAALASPTFTGTPAAPTAAANTNTTQIATTAFVVGQAGASLPAMDGAAATGTSVKFARDDHVHPTDTSRAPTSRQISTSGLASGGGDLSENRTINVAAAAASDFRAKTNTTKALTAAAVWGAMAEVNLTLGATITPDFAAGVDFLINGINQNFTLANPSNVVPGQKGRIRIIQDATGSRTMAVGSYYSWANGASRVLSTAGGAWDYLDYDVLGAWAGGIRLSLSKNWGT